MRRGERGARGRQSNRQDSRNVQENIKGRRD